MKILSQAQIKQVDGGIGLELVAVIASCAIGMSLFIHHYWDCQLPCKAPPAPDLFYDDAMIYLSQGNHCH